MGRRVHDAQSTPPAARRTIRGGARQHIFFRWPAPPARPTSTDRANSYASASAALPVEVVASTGFAPDGIVSSDARVRSPDCADLSTLCGYGTARRFVVMLRPCQEIEWLPAIGW